MKKNISNDDRNLRTLGFKVPTSQPNQAPAPTQSTEPPSQAFVDPTLFPSQQPSVFSTNSPTNVSNFTNSPASPSSRSSSRVNNTWETVGATGGGLLFFILVAFGLRRHAWSAQRRNQVSEIEIQISNTRRSNPNSSLYSMLRSEEQIEAQNQESFHDSFLAFQPSARMNNSLLQNRYRYNFTPGRKDTINSEKTKELLAAVRKQNPDIRLITDLINQGADIEAKDMLRNDLTVLGTAIITGCANCVNLLLNMGANIEGKADNRGSTPLMIAALYVQVKVIKLLIDRGADIRAMNRDNETVLTLIRINPGSLDDSLRRSMKSRALHAIISSVALNESCKLQEEWISIQSNELANPQIQNYLNNETITFLAAILPKNHLRAQIISKFSDENPSHSSRPNSTGLSLEDRSKIAKLVNLRDFLLEVLMPQQQAEAQAQAKVLGQVNSLIAIANTLESNLNNLPTLNLDRQTATFLAAIIDPENTYGRLRRIVIEQFNAQNPERQLDDEIFDGKESKLLREVVANKLNDIKLIPLSHSRVKSLEQFALVPASKELFKRIEEFFQEQKKAERASEQKEESAEQIEEVEEAKIATTQADEIPNTNVRNPNITIVRHYEGISEY